MSADRSNPIDWPDFENALNRSSRRFRRDFRVREGRGARNGSPSWDLTMVRVYREDKERFEDLRIRLSLGGRVLPHWEVFELAVLALHEELTKREHSKRGREDPRSPT